MKKIKLISTLLATLLMTSVSVLGAEIPKEGVVVETAQAYESPEDGKATCYVYEGETFEIVEALENYYGVLLDENEVIYIEKSNFQLNEEVKEKTAEASPENAEKTVKEQKAEPVKKEAPKAVKSKGEEVAAYAKKFIGTPYVSGGNSLTKGVDCSGFTQQVFLNFNVKLNRSSRDQYANNGVSVKKSDLKPGDLVFYGYSSVTHVAIYIGDNQIIHSPVPGKTVSIAPLWQRGDAPIIGYKRVV